MRRLLPAVVALAVLAAPLTVTSPVRADAGACAGETPLDPEHQTSRVVPRPAGFEEQYCIFFGPYTIPPGQDLSRVDLDLALAPGFVVAGGPSMSLADGTEPSHQEAHIHHAHWWNLDPEGENYGPQVPWLVWTSGSGEEETEGDFGLIADSDPGGPGYGLQIRRGEKVVLINMIHNKTAAPLVVWVRVSIRFVHGTPEDIQHVTGRQYRNLTPVLVGSTFDVERGSGEDGRFVWPFHKDGGPTDPGLYDGQLVPGVGQVWTAPFSGTIVLGAAHLHPGGKRVTVTNWGRADDPCPDDRTDGIPGTTMYELDVVDRVAPFSEEFQIEITQPGFRASVREGDRLVLNGLYDSSTHAWYDAMSHTGFYVDRHEVPDTDACGVHNLGRPAGWSPPLYDPGLDPTEGVANRPWSGEPDALCGDPYGPSCDADGPAPERGPATHTVAIAGFQYAPGAQSLPAPAVERGTRVRFVNADIGAYVRHTVTSCPAPCDGPYVGNYPLPDGAFDSGYLGYEPSAGGAYIPAWTLDTAELDPALYTYYCRVHPWMRGALYVD